MLNILFLKNDHTGGGSGRIEPRIISIFSITAKIVEGRLTFVNLPFYWDEEFPIIIGTGDVFFFSSKWNAVIKKFASATPRKYTFK